MEQKDVVIIGGGPAGLAAAVELHKQGIRNMIILEREAMLGGILRQCIHDFEVRIKNNDGDSSMTVSVWAASVRACPARNMHRRSLMK